MKETEWRKETKARKAVAALSEKPTCPYCLRELTQFYGANNYSCLSVRCVADGRDLRNG